MRDVSAECREVLASGDYAIEWVADLLYDDDPRAQNLRLLEPKFRWDGSAQIQGSGSCGVLADDMFGQSIVPREIGDLFSPFGAELQVDVRVRAGEFVERIPMGRFVLDSVPSAVEYAVANPNPPRVPVYSPWVEQRRNVFPDPLAVGLAAFAWQGSSGASGALSTIVVDDLPVATTAVRGTLTGNATTWRRIRSAQTWAVVAGETWTFSVQMRSSRPLWLSPRIQWLNSSGGQVAETPYVLQYSESGVWKQYVATFTAPTGAVEARVYADVQSNQAGAIGDTLDASEWQMERSDAVRPLLAGSLNPGGALERTRWLGTTNASASVVETREITSWVTGHAEPVIVESTVDLDLSDYFMRVARDEFPFPTSPKSTSMWDEAQRLTGLPVFRSIDDRVLPTNITYEKDRLEALGKVFGPSNAWPALTSQGALTARPKAWPDPVGRLDRVLYVSSSMRSENVYNRVVVEGKNPDPDGPPLIAVAEITDGFLRVRNPGGGRSPFGGATYNYQSEFLTTQAMCQQTADDMLPRVAKLRSATRRVVIPFNPLFETGDVLTLVDPTRMSEESLVRVQTIEHSGAETVLEVEVRE